MTFPIENLGPSLSVFIDSNKAKYQVQNLNTDKVKAKNVGVQCFGEWRGAAKFYMLRKRSEHRSNSNQTSVFQTTFVPNTGKSKRISARVYLSAAKNAEQQ